MNFSDTVNGFLSELNLKVINLKALFAAILFVGVVGGFTAYFAVSTYSTGATLKEASELYQYKTIEQHLVNIEQLLKEIKERK